MTTADSEALCSAIRRTLLNRAAGAPDAGAIAEATLGIWRQMAARLAPMIGARGVDALFVRSLYLTTSSFPWLAVAGDHGDSAALLASLKVRFAGRETDVAMEASYNLLATFTELLTTLIGEYLTERLLGSVWVPAPQESQQENAP